MEFIVYSAPSNQFAQNFMSIFVIPISKSLSKSATRSMQPFQKAQS